MDKIDMEELKEMIVAQVAGSKAAIDNMIETGVYMSIAEANRKLFTNLMFVGFDEDQAMDIVLVNNIGAVKSSV